MAPTWADPGLLNTHQTLSAEKYPKRYAENSETTFLPTGNTNESIFRK